MEFSKFLQEKIKASQMLLFSFFQLHFWDEIAAYNWNYNRKFKASFKDEFHYSKIRTCPFWMIDSHWIEKNLLLRYNIDQFDSRTVKLSRQEFT